MSVQKIIANGYHSGLLFRSSKLKEKNKNKTKTVKLTRLIDMLLFMNFNVSSFGLYLKK